MTTAQPSRRGLIALMAAAPAAAAAGGASPAALALGRMQPGFAGGRFAGAVFRLGSSVDRAVPLDPETPAELARLAVRVESAAGPILAQAHAELRAIAALATAFPAEIAAYRSFAPHLRRRLYAELLAREDARLTAATRTPPTPPASPGSGT